MQNVLKIRVTWCGPLIFLLFILTCYGLTKKENLKSDFYKDSQLLLVDEESITDVLDVIVELDATVVLKKDGTVWGWGKNQNGQLGVGRTFEHVAMPIETSSGPLINVTAIDFDDKATIAIRTDGSYWRSSDDSLLFPWTKNKSYSNSQNINNKSKKQYLLNKNSIEDKSNFLPSQDTFLEKASLEESLILEEEPFAITLSATGPYRDPASVELVASVTHPANNSILKIEFYNGANLIGSVTEAPYEISYKNLPQGKYIITAIAYDDKENTTSAVAEFEVVSSNRYNRGFGTDQRYLSSLIALDFERGIPLDHVIDFQSLFPLIDYPFYPWFLRVSSGMNEPCYHICHQKDDTISYPSVNYLPVVNGTVVGEAPPMVAFGVQGGGDPLYINQNYHIGVVAGGKKSTLSLNPDIKVEVYDPDSFNDGATNVLPICEQCYTLPRIGAPSTFLQFNSNGNIADYHLTSNYNGKLIDLDTQIQIVEASSPHDRWGQATPSPLIITHNAGNDNFYYKVSIMGATASAANPAALLDMAKNQQQTTQAYNITYSLDFTKPAPWQKTFITLPHFQGAPLPNSYQGKSVDELIHRAAVVEDNLPPPSQLTLNLTNINNSPELKSHPVLDQLVAAYTNDPIALANYVINEIELTDAIGYNPVNAIDDPSINPQGVSRDALGTYLESQGSPIEQCGLLIYLLRKAGISAAYVFPPHNQTIMFDEQLSKLLKIQLRGAVDDLGHQECPELIPVNYPWVVAYINNSWVHIFPWLKDTEISEGYDIWHYFPNGYQTETQWFLHYLLNDPSIRGLSQEDNLGTLFPLYAEHQLNQVGLSSDDVGMRCRNRPHCYTASDFPHPWQTPLISSNNLVQNLDAAQNPAFAAALTNLFDTINVQIIGVTSTNNAFQTNTVIETGPMRLADLHDRRLLLYHKIIPEHDPVQFEMTLSLEPYDNNSPGDCAHTYTFNTDSNPDPMGDFFRSAQKQVVSLPDEANTFYYNIVESRQQQASSIDPEKDYEAQFPHINNTTKFFRGGYFQKGSMVCLNLNYGRVTEEMEDIEAKKYWDYQQETEAASSTNSIDPERGIGQLLQVMGKNYNYNMSKSRFLIEELTKQEPISYLEQGLIILAPERNADGSLKIITTNGQRDLNLQFPSTNIFFEKATSLRGTKRLDSGCMGLNNDDLVLVSGEGSANEHRIINEFFGQENAISSVRLLDIAQGWTPETKKAEHPGVGVLQLGYSNFGTQLNKAYESAPGTVVSSTGTPMSVSLLFQDWLRISALYQSILNNIRDPFSILIMTPAPVKATGENAKPYVGMGVVTIGNGGFGATVTEMHLISNRDGTVSNVGNVAPDPPLHGGVGEALKIPILPGSSTPTWLSQCALTKNSHGGYTFSFLSNDDPICNDDPSEDDAKNIDNSRQYLSPDFLEMLAEWDKNALNGRNSTLSKSGGATATILKKEQSLGNTGKTSFYGEGLPNFVMDPVSVVTGEFYINTLDLKLPGPMPLEVRRLYSSQDRSENNIGAGWKLGNFSYLMLSDDGSETAPPSLIYAAEMDGSVIAYRYDSSKEIWAPQLSDNPNLINANTGALLASQNFFNNRITKINSNNSKSYLLKSSDGSARLFTVRSFPVVGVADVTRTRPYLETWSDTQGNSLHFSFGNNNKANDWGQLNAITASNGSSLHFFYDVRGRITEAFASDGRHLYYTYDNHGDLIQVILPDKSSITYQYAHAIISESGNKGVYSTHLLTREVKPGGRVLQNNYDDQRRVIAQAASGVTSRVTQQAAFAYSLAKNSDNTVSGVTTVTDAKGNTTNYKILNSQIVEIIYPANNSGVHPNVTQGWSTNGGFRALITRTDQRGFLTSYAYDSQGNLTSRIESGNLTGSASEETATTLFSYNENNLLVAMRDPVGNSITYAYNDAKHLFNPTSIIKTALGTIHSTLLSYQDYGGAHGLLSSINKGGAVTSFTYDRSGFLTSMTQQTGTQDPARSINITCNKRGEIIATTDGLGQKRIYDYDMAGRLIFEEVLDATGAAIDWHSCYYNSSGELQWEQGARINPVDYTYYDYDYAGRLVHKGSWRSAALADGSGITSAGIAATSNSYDVTGNLVSSTDENGHVSTMTYDALGEMIKRSWGDGIASESFSYEPGGQVATHTTPLGGVEQNSYNARGEIIRALHADGTMSSYRYDLSGRLIQEIFPNGSSWNLCYDDVNRAMVRTFSDKTGNILGTEKEYFDENGNKISWIDRGGATFNASYDALGRMLSFQGPSGTPSSAQQTKKYQYGLNSWSVVNGLGESQITYVDALNRPVQMSFYNGDGSVAYQESCWYALDHQSVIVTKGSSNAISTTLTTDTSGHPIILKNADGSCQVFAYDAHGNKISFHDEEGNVASWCYDALNHITSETAPGGATTTYSCNVLGEPLSSMMPGGVTKQNSYNVAGKKITEALVGRDGAITRNYVYGYNAGVISSLTDPRGFTTTINYDAWQRPVSFVSSGSSIPEQNQTTRCTYDARGLMTSLSQNSADPSAMPSTKIVRDYDDYGQLAFEKIFLGDTEVAAWKESWNGAGERVALNWMLDTQESGAQYDFSYNAFGLMTTARNSTGTCFYGYGDNALLLSRATPFGTTTITRNQCGAIMNERLPTGALESLSWRPDGRLNSYSMSDRSGALVDEIRNYSYDAACRIIEEPFTSQEKGTQAAHYFFDQSPLCSGNSLTTGVGVRTSELVDDVAANQVICMDGFERVTQWSNEAGLMVESSYDAAGNTITYGNRSLTWDSFGRRLQTSYSDATGNQMTSAPLQLRYYYDPEVEFLELGHDYYGRTWNLFGPDRSGLYGGVQGIGGMETTYAEQGHKAEGVLKNFFGDSLGSLNGLGLYAWDEVIGGYGAMPGFSVNTDLVPQWRGHYLDWTGFYDMGARYYDPANGRFLSADPLGNNASKSLYDYCDGDPVNRLDPDGRCFKKGKEALNNAEVNVRYSWDQACAFPDADVGARILAGIPVSLLSGDAFSHYTTPEEWMHDYGFMPSAFSVNGIFSRDANIRYMRTTAASGLGISKDAVFPVENPSYGPLDFIRAEGQEFEAIDITALRAAAMLNAAGGGTVVTHSNGSALFYAASRLLHPEVKANIAYKGYGPQININAENVPGLRSYYNDAGSHDLVPNLLNHGRAARWDRVIPQDPFHPLNNHSFETTYAPDVLRMQTL